VILIYHRVGGRSPIKVDLPIDTFSAQMEALAASGSVMALDEAVDALGRGEDLTGSTVITFDDGTSDFVSDALPVLDRFQIPATLYVATKFVDEQIEFPDRGAPTTWADLRDAMGTGLVSIGSHTHSHALLDRLEPSSIADELDRSIDLIGEHLGVDARHFAYPKALAPSAAAEHEVRSRFRSAALAGTRANPVATDVFRLWRSPVQTTDTAAFFRRKAAGGMRLEDDLRQLVNRRRYQGASA